MQERKSDTFTCPNHRAQLPTLSSQKRCFRYHIPIPSAGFYDNGYGFLCCGRYHQFPRVPFFFLCRSIWKRAGPNFVHELRPVVLHSALPKIQRLNKSRLASMRTPRTKKRTRPPCASQPDCASSARNQPRALSLTGKSKRHDQVACRKARERSRVVVEPGAVVIATR